MSRIKACLIAFEDDGSTVDGNTFCWDADDGELKEGPFDLKDWLINQREIHIEESTEFKCTT
jgi:hypothetical protein